MPSYIEIDQNLNFPSSSGAGKVIFGVNTSGQATITDNTGNTTVIGTGVGGSVIPMHPQVITSEVSIPNNYNALLLGDVQISGSLNIGSGSNLSVFELDQNPTASYAIQAISASYAPDSRPYKVYTALLFQTASSAPAATVLENTLGNITYQYEDVGYYYISSSNLFTPNKTYTNLQLWGDDGASPRSGVVMWNSSSTLSLLVRDYLGNSTNYIGDANNPISFLTSIEIRVYN